MVLYVRYLGIFGRHAEVSVDRQGDLYSAELTIFSAAGNESAQVFCATAKSPDKAEKAARLKAIAYLQTLETTSDAPPTEDRG